MALLTFLRSYTPPFNNGVFHITAIPHSPTGQAIIERTHATLKTLLLQQEEGMLRETPQNHLAKALNVYNFYGDNPITPIVKHITATKECIDTVEKAQVLLKDPESNQI